MSLISSGNVRYFILFLSFLTILVLVGNLLLFNILLVYPHANHLLPQQYKVNSTIEIIKDGHLSPIQKRAISSNRKTTAHPIPLKGAFLETQSTSSPKTKRTRRTQIPSRPATILTNPNIPTLETTTLSQLRLIEQIVDVNETSLLTELIEKSKQVPSLQTKSNVSLSLNTNMSTAEMDTQSKTHPFLNRDWVQFIQEVMLFSSAGLGMLMGYLPLSHLLRSYGARKVIAISLAFSAVFMVLQMQLIVFGEFYICALRLLHGVTCAPLFAFIGINAARWSTLKEQLTFLTTSFLAILLAPALFWFFVYKIIDASVLFELQLLHYALAGLTILLAILWVYFYRNTPQQHKWVNGIELNRIVTGKLQNNRIMDKNVLSLLFKSVSTWSIYIASFAYFTIFSLMANFLPIYLVTILKVNLCTMLSLTFIVAILCHTLCLLLNKLLFGCSSLFKMRAFNTFGFILSAVIFVCLALLPPNADFVNTSRIILLFCLLPLGFTTLGFINSSVVYGRYFTQYIITHMQLPFSLAVTLTPLFVVFVTVDNALRYWRLVFGVMALILFLSAVIFDLLISGQPASWAEHSWDPTSTYKMRNIDYISRSEECGLLELRRLDGPEKSEYIS